MIPWTGIKIFSRNYLQMSRLTEKQYPIYQWNIGFGINSFTGQSDTFEYLKILNPKYIKSDCAFLFDQSDDSMAALNVVVDALGIQIISTYVQTKEDIKKLEEMNIFNIQGSIVNTINPW